jgi:hypothetical protein
MNALPFTVIVNAPLGIEAGEILVNIGTGFINVTLPLAEAVASAALSARMVTKFEVGTTAGAVNTPEALITPDVALPPVTPLTCQVTVVFDDPVTDAVKVCVAPALTLAVAGDTETATPEGDDEFPEFELGFEGPLVAPVHPVSSTSARVVTAQIDRIRLQILLNQQSNNIEELK